MPTNPVLLSASVEQTVGQKNMPDQSNLASFSKLSDVAVSLVRDMSKNLPLVVALGITSLGVLAWLPVSDLRARVVLVAFPLFAVFYYLGLLWDSYRPIRQQRHFLKRLGKDEKRVLRLFLEQDRRTMHMNVFYAPTASLIAKGILGHTTSTFPAFGAAMVIQNYSYYRLCRYPELIDMKKEEIGKDEIDDADCTWMTKP